MKGIPPTGAIKVVPLPLGGLRQLLKVIPNFTLLYFPARLPVAIAPLFILCP